MMHGNSNIKLCIRKYKLENISRMLFVYIHIYIYINDFSSHILITSSHTEFQLGRTKICKPEFYADPSL